ncbi:MAG: hypothetical protein ACXWCP_32695 [Burkholderiales bacterium]
MNSMPRHDVCVVLSRQALFGSRTTAAAPALAQAFEACVPKDWRTGAGLIEPHAAEHERIGGSRAQRDLIELTLRAAGRTTVRLRL